MTFLRTRTALIAAIAVASGCGGDADYANEPRPPTPINVSAAITKDRVTVSPAEFGAGPVTVLISNQTEDAHRITVESDQLGADAPGIRQSTAPINPEGTATLQIDIRPGRYRVAVDDDVIDAASVRVGKPRPDSSDQLLTP